MLRLHTPEPIDQPLTEADIDSAFASLLDTRSKFSHWHMRLAEHFSGAELDWVRLALAKLAKSAKGLRESTLSALPGAPDDPADALLLLEEHGYIVRQQQTLHFQSPLVRQYWKNNHAK